MIQETKLKYLSVEQPTATEMTSSIESKKYELGNELHGNVFVGVYEMTNEIYC